MVGVMEIQVGVLRWGGGAVQVGGVQVGRGRFSGGRGANGQTLWELKRSKGANVGEGRELMGIFLQFEFNF